jgi:hypothetical protein
MSSGNVPLSDRISSQTSNRQEITPVIGSLSSI